MGEALEVLEELMLLRRFNVVYDTEQYAEWAYAPPLRYEVVLVGELLYVIVERGWLVGWLVFIFRLVDGD